MSCHHTWRGAETGNCFPERGTVGGSPDTALLPLSQGGAQQEGPCFVSFSCHFCVVKWRAGSMKAMNVIVKRIKDLNKGGFLLLVYSQAFLIFCSVVTEVFLGHLKPWIWTGVGGRNLPGSSLSSNIHVTPEPSERFMNDRKEYWFGEVFSWYEGSAINRSGFFVSLFWF